MQTIQSITSLREQLALWRSQGAAIALVPTMGNLHAGHLHLVKEAAKRANRVVVSIFVNPSQFGPTEDFSIYPRTPEADTRQLQAAGVDLLFMPDGGEMYPISPERMTQVEVPGLSSELCGKFRPGHFRGVATVVCKLFNQVQPDIAVFGEKDYQQLAIIRRMATDLDLPVRAIVGVPTVREPDGLAMSSRNAYLSPDQRKKAVLIHACLQSIACGVQAGRRDFGKIEAEQAAGLTRQGFDVDYVALRRAGDLEPPGEAESRLVALVAARLGGTRLIDNLPIDLGD